MSTVHVAAQLSTDELLKAIKQLSLPELEQFVSQAIALQAQRKAPSLSRSEAQLLLEINQGLAPAVQRRYDELITKRRAETLTPHEHEELLRLTNQSEQLEARRVQLLSELARLRQTTVAELMDNLGLRPAAYV
ncbi:MAG TPA: STAS/SEC14 domain-containing protein [Anaerolineae bacterium]|nr:STAS/SEC14 domain-containing protein [Anaerolineae bacterium]